jgi:hypothetical protein
MTASVYQFPEHLMQIAEVDLKPVTIAQGSRGAQLPQIRTRGVVQAYWRLDMSFAALEKEDWRELSAFISRLDGQRNRVSIYDPSRERPLGAGFGTAVTYSWEYDGTPYAWEYDGTTYLWQAGAKTSVWLAASASRGADRVTLGGLTASTAKAVKRGDLLGIGGNLHEVVTEGNSDSSGESTVQIRPRLHKPASALATVQVDKPRGRFALASMDSFSQSITPPTLSRSASLSLVEVPDVGVVY